jgi:hypothetical protein
VRREIHPVEVLSWRAGTIDPVLCGVVMFACAMSVAVASVGIHTMYGVYRWELEPVSFWKQNGIAAFVAGWIVACGVPRWQLSRFLRIAVLLPIAHVIAMIGAWRVWESFTAAPTRIDALIDTLPIYAVVVVGAVVFVIAAWLVTRRGHRYELAHGLVVISLVDLLLLGLWLPVASWLWCHDLHDSNVDVAHPWPMVAFVLVPPLVAAIAIAATVIRRPHAMPALRRWGTPLLAVLFVCAISTRTDDEQDPYYVYSNFVHVLIAVGFLAVMSLAVLGVSTWIRARRSRRMLASDDAIEGIVTVTDDDHVVACVEITSWLRGPRPIVRSCVLATAHGELPIPSVQLAAPLPATTTTLAVGESVEALRSGDRVVVAGFERARGGHPFRGGQAPIAGVDGVYIGRRDADVSAFANVVLTLWRPCIAYLGILVVVGVPSLIAAFVFV